MCVVLKSFYLLTRHKIIVTYLGSKYFLTALTDYENTLQDLVLYF